MPVASCFNSLLISGLHFPGGYSFCINKTAVTDTLRKMGSGLRQQGNQLEVGAGPSAFYTLGRLQASL